MSTDDAGTAKDAENTEAGDVAANTGESIEQAAPSLEKKQGSGESAKKDEAETSEPTTAGAGKSDSDAVKSESGKSESGKSESGKSEPVQVDDSREGGTAPLVAAFAAGVLLVAAITAVVVFYLQADKRGDELAAIEDSTHAACSFSRNVTSYDSQNLDEFFTTVKAGSTGEFLKQFADAADTLKEVLLKSQVKSRADDVQCGYQSGDTDSAKVLVTMTLVRGSATQAAPPPEFITYVADMKNEGGTWKVSKLDSPLLAGSGGGGLPGGASVPSGQAPAPGN